MADVSSAVSAAVGKPPADVNLADSGASVLKGLSGFTDRLGPAHLGFLYDRWKSHPCAAPDIRGGPPALGDAGSPESTDLPKLRKLGFGYYDGAAKRLGNLSTAGGALVDAGKSMAQEIGGVWQDKAGEAAGDTFLNIAMAAAHYQDATGKLGAAMSALWRNSRQAVQTLAEFAANDEAGASNDVVGGNGGQRFMGDYGTEDQLNVGDWSGYIDQLNDKLGQRKPLTGSTTWGQVIDTVDPLAGLANEAFGSDYTAEDLRQPGVPLGDNQVFGIHFGSVKYTNDTINHLDDFGHNYIAVVKNFRAQIQATAKAVTGQLNSLVSAVNGVATNPFDDLQLGAPQKSTPPPPSSGGGGGLSGGGAPGGGATTASSYTPPPLPDPSTALTGTGVPAAVDPGTAVPGTPETVTVQSGNSTIAMTSPDGQGTVKLTVDDGTGTPKTYDVAFGHPTADPTATDPTGTPAVPGGSGTTTGVVGADPAGAAGAQPVLPGADGNAVIHDGNLTITATEPNGSGGPVRIAVDDGTGHPTTYTLDSSGTAAPTGPSAPVQPLTGATTGSSGAMPSGTGAIPGGVDPGLPQPAVSIPATPPVMQVGAPPVDLSGQTVSADYTTPAAHSGFADNGTGYSDGTAYSGLGSTSLSSFAGPVPGGAGLAGGPLGGGGSSFGGTVEHHSGGVDHANGMWSGPHDPHGQAGLAGTDDQHHDGPGDAGLAIVPSQDGDPAQATGAAPMPGGLGGGLGGGGGGGGGDATRGASAWRTQGQLFDDVVDAAAGRFSGVLDEEGQQGR